MLADVLDVKQLPLQTTKLPGGLWERVSTDFAGPLPNNDMILILWDQYARYLVVEFVTTTAAESTICMLDCVCTIFRIPKEIKMDNDSPFNGTKFSEFAETQGFKHRKVMPKWAEANRDVIRIIQIVKKSAKIARIEGKNIQQEIQTTVRSYCNTPHVNMGESPNKLLFRRVSKQTVRESVQQRNAEFKQM